MYKLFMFYKYPYRLINMFNINLPVFRIRIIWPDPDPLQET